MFEAVGVLSESQEWKNMTDEADWQQITGWVAEDKAINHKNNQFRTNQFRTIGMLGETNDGRRRVVGLVR